MMLDIFIVSKLNWLMDANKYQSNLPKSISNHNNRLMYALHWKWTEHVSVVNEIISQKINEIMRIKWAQTLALSQRIVNEIKWYLINDAILPPKRVVATALKSLNVNWTIDTERERESENATDFISYVWLNDIRHHNKHKTSHLQKLIVQKQLDCYRWRDAYC